MGRCLHNSSPGVTCGCCWQPELQQKPRDAFPAGMLIPREGAVKAQPGLSAKVRTLEKVQTDITWTIPAELSFPRLPALAFERVTLGEEKRASAF